MSNYAVYDLKSGHIVHTHVEVDVGGISKTLSDDQVLAALPEHINREDVGVIAIAGKRRAGMRVHVDPKTRKLVETAHK